VVREAGEAVGLRVRFVDVELGSGEGQLFDGEIDAVAPASVLSGRMQGMGFTAPLMVTRGAVWVRLGEGSRVTAESLRKMRLAVATNGVGHQWGIEKKLHVIPVGTLQHAFQTVLDGAADGVVTSQSAGRWEIEARGLKGLEEVELDDPRLWRAFAIATRGEDKELVAMLNAGLEMLRGSGRYDQLYDELVAKYQPRSKPESFSAREVAIGAGVTLAVVLCGVVWVITLRRQLEKRTRELRASEAKYRELTEYMPGMVYSYMVYSDGRRQMVYESPSVAEWKKWYPGLEIGPDFRTTILPHIHREDQDRYIQASERARRERQTFDIEYRVISREGETRWVHAVLRPIEHANGVEWQGLSLDVTPLRRAEQAHGESEEKFREIFEHSHDAILVFDAESGVIIEANQRAAELYGYTVEELRGSGLDRLVPTNTNQERPTYTGAQIGEMLRGKARCEFLTQCRRADGTLMHVEVAASMIRIRGRDVVLSMGRDVGARISAEEALKQSQKRYREFVMRSTEAVYRIENRNGISVDASVTEVVDKFFEQAVISECNDAMAAIHGVASAEEFAGTPLKKIMDPADPVNRELVRRFVAGGLRLADAEARRVDSVGNERWFRLSMVGQIEQGEFVRCWGIQREETEQKLAQRQLADTQARLAVAVAGAGICTWKLNLLTDQIDADANYLAFFGLGATSRPSRADILAHVHEEDRKSISVAIERAIRGGGPYMSEYRILQRDSAGIERVRWVASRGTVQRDEHGRAISLTGASTDITENKHAAEERERFLAQLQKSQKLESLGVMAGGVAHDFNNILVGILGSAGLAMTKVAAGEDVKETLETIERAAGRAADLTKQLLAYSGRGRVVTTSLCMTELVRECAELLTIAAGSSCRVVRDLGSELPLISGDATQLSQVILNLVRNAAEALPQTGGEIVIRTGLVQVDASRATELSGARLQPGTFVCLSVADNGAGMTAETRARIFEPFFTTKFTGRGLGLSSVLGIIQAHGGAVHVRSEIGRGTTFEVYLPQLQGAAAHAKPLTLTGQSTRAQFVEARETAHPKALVGEGSILVVDDEKLVRDLVCAVLRYAGYRVEQAHDGFKALELIKADTSIRLTVLDMTMPTISGEETMKLIQVIRPQMAFLLSSGFADAIPEHVLRHDGLVRFLPKPYRNQELTEAVASLLGSAGITSSSASA
jgi:PAS domain S-box-containing protein